MVQSQIKHDTAIRRRYPFPRRGAYDDVALEIPVADPTFKERRGQQRIRFEALATVSAGQHTLAASTKDISIRGIFLLTDVRFEEGSEIDIMLALPEELGLSVSGMVRCRGRVVRVDSTGGQYGLAVKLDRLEVVAQV
jgi:PilZ domain-containing protein